MVVGYSAYHLQELNESHARIIFKRIHFVNDRHLCHHEALASNHLVNLEVFELSSHYVHGFFSVQPLLFASKIETVN